MGWASHGPHACAGLKARSSDAVEPATEIRPVLCRGSGTRRNIAHYRPNEPKRDRAFPPVRRSCRC